VEYKASLDSLCKVITTGVIVLFIAIGQKNVRAILITHNLNATLIHAGILFLFVATIVGSYLFSIKSYTVTRNEFIVHRPIKDRVIKISDIIEIRTVDSSEFSGTIRTFGVSGLFGYYGKYYNSKIGNMTWYVTHKENKILIRTQQGDKIIISPDDISLVEEVQMKR
jgi:hypothetical protein